MAQLCACAADSCYVASGFARDKSGRWFEIVKLMTEDKKDVCKFLATPTEAEERFADEWLDCIDDLRDYAGRDQDLECKVYLAMAAEVIKVERRKAAEGGTSLSKPETKARIRKVIGYVYVERLAACRRNESLKMKNLIDILRDVPGVVAEAYGNAVEGDSPFKVPEAKRAKSVRPTERVPAGRVVVPFPKSDPRPDVFVRLVECEVNGHKCRLLIDTAATFSLLSEKLCGRIGVDGIETSAKLTTLSNGAYTEKRNMKTCKVSSFKIGDADFGAATFDVMPMAYSDGVIGADILCSLPTLLAFAGKSIVFNPSADDLAGFGKGVRFCENSRGGRNFPLVHAKLGERNLRVLVDTGANLSRAGLTLNWPEDGPSREGSMTDVFGTHKIREIPGKSGEITICGTVLGLTPVIFERKGPKLRVGAKDLQDRDLFIDGNTLSIR